MTQMQDVLYAFSRQYCIWAKRHRCRHYGHAYCIHMLLMYITTLSSEAE